MLASLSGRSIGEIRLDAVTSEDHSSELNITENPIESGGVVADHAVVRPKSVVISGVMVDHDHGSSPLEELGVPYIRGVTDFLNNLPFPIPVATKTVQTIAKANRLIPQAKGIISAVNDSLNAARVLAPWLPDFGLGDILGEQGGRVQQCYADLLKTQKSGEVITIQTGIFRYEDMLIESLSVRQTQDGSAEFTITARQVLIVDTQTVATAGQNQGSQKSSPNGKSKSGRASTQSASKVVKGKVQTVTSGGKDGYESGLNHTVRVGEEIIDSLRR